MKDDFHLESGTYGYDEDDDEWNEDEANWDAGEGDAEEIIDVKDESTAYLEFLQEEVMASSILRIEDSTNLVFQQSAKYSNAAEGDYSEEELGEDSVLLESVLDKIDPYTSFRASLMSMSWDCIL